VDAAGGAAEPGSADRDLLAFMDLVPDPALLGARPAEDEAARNVRLIALDRAAAVHQHDLALAHRLGLARAMRIGARLAEQDQREFGRAAERLGGAVHDRRDPRRIHAELDPAMRVAIG